MALYEMYVTAVYSFAVGESHTQSVTINFPPAPWGVGQISLGEHLEFDDTTQVQLRVSQLRRRLPDGSDEVIDLDNWPVAWADNVTSFTFEALAENAAVTASVQILLWD